MRYTTVDSVPLHVFSNKECTYTPNPELREYLQYMLDNHPYDLAYLWRWTQQYPRHGGCYVMTMDYWLDKLRKDLIKQSEE